MKSGKLRAFTMLNEDGDTTLAWTEDMDDAMEQIIQKKMDAGVTFFIIDPRLCTRQPLKRASDAARHRMLAVRDEDLAKFVGEGTVDVIKTPDQPATVKRKAQTAREVVENETVGVTPRRGG